MFAPIYPITKTNGQANIFLSFEVQMYRINKISQSTHPHHVIILLFH